jgi:diacylglycerol kinase
MNTALEHLTDRLHPEQHPAIRAAKDCAAAAVLLASISALLIGLLTLAVGLHLLHNA